MATLILIGITLTSIVFFFIKLIRKSNEHKNLPKGSFGYFIIGETLSFLKAQREDKGHEWINQRVKKHGPIFKTSLMGAPTVVIVGQAGNKFVLGADGDVLAAKQPPTIQAIGGKFNLFELTGQRYKLVKGAMMNFLKPESLQNYINQMDTLIKNLILQETKEKQTIQAVHTMKKLTFNIACIILFGIKDEITKDALFDDFNLAFKSIWSLPINFPGTKFHIGLQARSRIVKRLLPIMRIRKHDLDNGVLGPNSDVLACLLTLRDENQQPLSDEAITDNLITLVIASHDTSAILLSLMIWKLAREPMIYNKVLEEQMEILKIKEEEEGKRLTWGNLQKMKYTWRVAQEIMRIIPPVFGSFRKTLKDTSYAGYHIPKGSQLFWVACATHMDKSIFDNPSTFDPTRFENPSKPIPPYTYIPFGGGIRTCIGNEFARVETLITIHNLVTMFEWSQVNPDEIITRQPMPYPSMGLPIKLKPRHI